MPVAYNVLGPDCEIGPTVLPNNVVVTGISGVMSIRWL